MIYTLGMLLGVREFLVSRDKQPFEQLSPEGQELLDMLSRLNPNDPDVHYLQAMHAQAEGNRQEFSRLLEGVLASDIKHNEIMLRFHANYLLTSLAEPQESSRAAVDDINAALNRWRRNFPFSQEEAVVPLEPGPETARQAMALENELERITWMADSRLERVVDQRGIGHWRVRVLFRRGRDIDIRDVMVALNRAMMY